MDIRLKNSNEAELLRLVLLFALEHVKENKPVRDVCKNVIEQIEQQLGEGL